MLQFWNFVLVKSSESIKDKKIHGNKNSTESTLLIFLIDDNTWQNHTSLYKKSPSFMLMLVLLVRNTGIFFCAKSCGVTSKNNKTGRVNFILIDGLNKFWVGIIRQGWLIPAYFYVAIFWFYIYLTRAAAFNTAAFIVCRSVFFRFFGKL